MADHRAALLAVRLAAVHEEVEAARRIELVVAHHALAQARDVLFAFGFDHDVEPLVAMVVADAHRAEREDAIVDDVELRVIEALAHVLDGDVRVREDPRGELVRLLLEASPARLITAPSTHAWKPRIGSTRLWKKLCLLPPVYS